MREKHLKST